MKNSNIFKSTVIWTIIWLLITVWVFVTLTPFFFMIVNSFKDQFEMLKNGIFKMPEILRFENYITVLGNSFLIYFKNSAVILVLSLFLLLFISACASYPLSRFKFKLNNSIIALIVASMAVPIHVTFIPIFIMTRDVGLYDKIWALIGPYVAFGLPISIFILTTFMKSIPKELEESAEIDGCGKYKTFFEVILPLSKAGLATLAIYNSVNIWKEFSFALILTQSKSSRTLPLAVWEYKGEYDINLPLIMTVLVLTSLPMIIVFIIAKDKLVKGMVAGAIKG
jgi:raffinose/stachyose/melibiose transport system permease protein